MPTAPIRGRNLLKPKVQPQVESNLKTIVPEEDDRRRMTLSDGREIYLKPIKMRKVARWTALFLGFAGLSDVKDGKISTDIDLTPEYIGRIAQLVPDLGDTFFDLMEPCLEGASPDDIEQDDAFDVISRFIEVNLTSDFLGKAMALAGGVRG